MGLFGGILSGLGGILGSVIGGAGNDKAIKKASKAQQAGIQAGIDEQRRQFDLTRSDYAPYLQAGTAGLGDLGDLIGINGPEKQAAALGVLQQSPLFTQTVQNGEEGILQNASATGGLRGGNVQRGLADFRADTFNNVIADQLSRLGGLAGLGQGATDSVSAFGANTANQVSSGLSSIGNSRFNSILGRQANWNNMGSQISQTIMNAIGAIGGGMPMGAG